MQPLKCATVLATVGRGGAVGSGGISRSRRAACCCSYVLAAGGGASIIGYHAKFRSSPSARHTALT